DMFGMEESCSSLIFLSFFFVSVMAHCRERGDEMIVGDLSHIHVYEQGGSAQLAGVHSPTVTTLGDGTFDLNQLISQIRHGYPDPHYPLSRLACVENAYNIQGGRVLPLSFLQELWSVADKFVLALHMDDARVMNAALALGIQPSAILQHCHSVSVCLSKGLGAPVGTMLGGSKDFIQRAVHACKALGGGMRQSGVLAAAGKIALSDMIGRLEEDHRKARSFAQALLQCDPPLYQLDLNTFCEQMAGVDEEEVEAQGPGGQGSDVPPCWGNYIFHNI
uniref:Threonine aldolase 1 n=1 Tax=Sinocyclocheilus grahami TaxID=75366 RepID=A0A672M4F5_SINGR